VTNEQIVLVAMGPFATLIVVMFGVFLNGRQIDSVRREIDSLRQELRAEIRASNAELKVEIAKLDQRLERLEGDRRVIR
jgi:hypothetical protein